MKFFAIISAALAVVSAIQDDSKYTLLAEGMLAGALDIDILTISKLKLCLTDAEIVLLDVATGLKDLTKFDMQGLMMFVDSIGAAFYEFLHMLEHDCNPFDKMEDKAEIIKKLEEIKLVFHNPHKVNIFKGRNLYMNNINVYDHFLKASALYL